MATETAAERDRFEMLKRRAEAGRREDVERIFALNAAVEPTEDDRLDAKTSEELGHQQIWRSE